MDETKLALEAKRNLLRHTLATLAYRGAKVVRDAPNDFATFRAHETVRTPGEVLAHIGDLLDWALRTAHGEYVFKVRLEMPSLQVDLTSLLNTEGKPVYPDASKPPAAPASIGEVKAVNEHQLLLIERDNLGDAPPPPRHKKIYLLDLQAADDEGRVTKSLLLDLLSIPDPRGIGGAGDFFRMPFYTIESVHVVDRRTLLVACDNNYPFSSGRSRSRAADRQGPLAADDTEIILVELGTELDVDPRLLPAGAKPR